MSKNIKLPYKLLIYDIETAPLQAYIWRLGEQVVRHNQLKKGGDQYNIITISYKWYGDSVTRSLNWDYNKQNSKKMIQEFDKVVKEADVILGKNSDSFDSKHINTQRLIHKLAPIPQWAQISDDLEKQLRKYFAFPSQSLDYISKLFGLGGKDKMEFDDWVKIVEKDPNGGKEAFLKMIAYNIKDVEDTEAILTRVLPYIKLRKNAMAGYSNFGCTLCGSSKVLPTKIISCGQTRYQEFECLEHLGYAGKATVRYDKHRNKTFGRMQ